MKLHKLKAGEATDTYLVDSPVSEADILLMAQQLANQRLRRGRSLRSPHAVFSHLQTLLADYEHEVFALLLLDSKHWILTFQELFRGTLDAAGVYPREVVKICLEFNAAAVFLVHNHPSGDLEPSQADHTLTRKLQDALNLVDIRTLDHIVVGSEGCVSLAKWGIYESNISGSHKVNRRAVRVRRHIDRMHSSAVNANRYGTLSTATDCSAAGLLDLQSIAQGI
jgi:DNA repair protein RadC